MVPMLTVQGLRMVPKPSSEPQDGLQAQFIQTTLSVCCCLQDVHRFHKASACGFVENALK